MLRTIRTGAIGTIVAVALTLVSLLNMTASTRAQEEERPYPKLLPLSEYLMDRNAAIALARSAAPGEHFKRCICFGAHAQRLGNLVVKGT